MNIEQAKKVLKENGYYVENLWHIDDVKQGYYVDDDKAYEVLDEVMQSEYIMQEVFETIDLVLQNYDEL